jgi:signal transduction histidine kinase
MTNDPCPPTVGDPLRSFEIARLRMARLQVEGAQSVTEVFREATEIAARTLAVERAGIWLFIDRRRALRCYDLFELSRGAHSEGTVLSARDFPTYFRALEERRDIPADEAQADRITRELGEPYLAPLGIVSMLDAPIYREGKVIGVICNEHTAAPRTWTVEERDFAGSMADMVAHKLDEAARHEAERALDLYRDQVLELQKTEALSRMAAGIAHDFKNVLAGMTGFAAIIVQDPQTGAEAAAAAREIVAAGAEGMNVVHELLMLGRQETAPTEVISPWAVLEAFRPFLQASVGKSYPVELRHNPPSGRVFLSKASFERVVLNLVLNARDAMPNPGPIAITVSEAHLRESAGVGDTFVVVEVCDRGIGMDEVTRARIFDPFFTTKERGRGTGLGLAVVQSLVDRCGGFIHVESAAGQGTTMRVYLPRIASEA